MSKFSLQQNINVLLVKLNLILFLIIIIPSQSAAQLFELEINQIMNDGPIPVFRQFPDKAGIIVQSSITNLRFDSNLEILDERSDPDEGTYRIIVEPVNQYLRVSAPGFMTNRIHLTSLRARDVLYYSIEPVTFMHDGDQTAERTFQDIKNTGIEFFNNSEFYFALDRFNDALRLRPNNARATRFKLQSEDEIAWNNAKILGTIEAYHNYLNGDTSKRYANEATEAIMNTHLELGEMHVNNNNIELAERYLIRYLEDYPTGPEFHNAENLLCKLYVTNGDVFSVQRNLIGQRTALNFYNQANDVCNETVGLDTKLQQTQTMYERYNFPRRGYSMFTTDKISSYGITFGSLNYFNRGGYLTLRLNEELFTPRSDFTVDTSGNITLNSTTTPPARSYEYTGNNRWGNAEVLIGFTYPVYFPAWVYAGLGYAYNPRFWQMDTFNSVGGFLETSWAKNTDESDRGIVFEFGGMASLIGLNIGLGLKGPNMSELTPTFSIGFVHSSSH